MRPREDMVVMWEREGSTAIMISFGNQKWWATVYCWDILVIKSRINLPSWKPEERYSTWIQMPDILENVLVGAVDAIFPLNVYFKGSQTYGKVERIV